MSINVPMTKFDTSRITNIVKNVINKCSVLFCECHSCHFSQGAESQNRGLAQVSNKMGFLYIFEIVRVSGIWKYES